MRAHDVAVSPEQAALVLVHVEAHPGIRLTDLLAAHPALSVDVVWTLLATRHVFTDLTRTPLMRHDQVSSSSGAHHVGIRLQAALSSPPRAAPAAPAACPQPPVLATPGSAGRRPPASAPGSAGWRGRAAEGHGSEGRRPPVEKAV